jgi:cell division protein ZipA
MEMGLRELLMLVGVIIIVAVAFDAFRRVRNERGPLPERDPLIEDDVPELYTEPLTQEEFPSGGARRKTLKEALAMSVAENQAAKAPSPVKAAPTERQEPSIGGETNERSDVDLLNENAQLSKASSTENQSAVQPQSTPYQSASQVNTASPVDKRPVEEVIVLNITAKPGEPFEGTLLHTQLLRHGLRYGDMQIFHYFEQTPKGQQTVFSAANLVKPGTLDPADTDMRTVGICLFFSLPGPLRPLQAFDRMLITAKNIAQQLGGDLRDETRSIMTQQTIQHTRQRVIDYERKSMMRTPVAAVS